MPSVTNIVVPLEDYESEDPWVVVDSLSGFARKAGDAGWSSADLPEEVRWNSQVTNAFGQISRNGPSLYFYNVLAPVDGTERWQAIAGATKRGLGALGDIPQVAVYDDLISIYDANRDSILDGRQRNQPFKLANDFDLLCRFMPSAAAETEFMQRRVAWVRTLQNVRPVARDIYEQELAAALSKSA